LRFVSGRQTIFRVPVQTGSGIEVRKPTGAMQSSAVQVPQHSPNWDGAAGAYFLPVPLFAAESPIANRGFAI
jgi:hypothetical protein